jgi:hypothetical protein
VWHKDSGDEMNLVTVDGETHHKWWATRPHRNNSAGEFMIKALVCITGVIIAIVNSVVAYRSAKRKAGFFTPVNFAVVAFSLTLFACIVIVVLLDKLGWYPD